MHQVPLHGAPGVCRQPRPVRDAQSPGDHGHLPQLHRQAETRGGLTIDQSEASILNVDQSGGVPHGAKAGHEPPDVSPVPVLGLQIQPVAVCND